jgi:chemotaxis-related protein WspD
MKLPLAPSDCWNLIGVRGDGSCPELAKVVHCHNCGVFAAAGRRFLDAPSPEGYLDEWTERLAAEPVPESAAWKGALAFRLGDEWLALPVAVLTEVTTWRKPHRVPHRGGMLAGLVNIRGELCICIHLDQLLGMPKREGPTGPRARLLVVRREQERWVFPVDEADRVHRYAQADLKKAPATVSRSLGRLTRGVLALGGRSVGLLDEERLFQLLRAKTR